MSRWFRFYSEAVDDPKVQMLPPELFRAWVNLLCIAAENNGVLCNVSETSHVTFFRLRVTKEAGETIIAELVSAGLIDKVKNHYEPHNWSKRQYKSDTSTERTKRHRERSRDVTVTPPEYRVQKREKEKEKEKNGKEKKGATNVFVELASPQWQAWQKLKPTPTIFSAEHHANGWWFPSLWPKQEDAA